MLKHNKLVVITLFFTLSLHLSLFAAEGKGYYITKSNDTVYTTFKIPYRLFSDAINFVALQSKIKYFDSTGKKQTLKPADIVKVYIKYQYQNYLYIACKNTIGLYTSLFNTSGYIFLKLETDGPLRLYTYFYQRNTGGYYNGTTWNGGSSYTAEKYVLQKTGKDIFRPKGLFFKKDMAAYLADYPELTQKIQNKELRLRDLESIVTEYNNWAIKNSNKAPNEMDNTK